MNVQGGMEQGGAGDEQASGKAFDLEKQKALSLQSLPPRGRESPAFKQFYKSKLCDDFLCAALDHVAALLRLDDLALARTAGKKPQDIPPPTSEEKMAQSLLGQTVKEVSTYYCYTIIQFSRYQAAQQDRMFFESLYEFITNIVVAAFPAQHKFRIEDEIARIVRTDTFNLTRRKNDPNHHSKMNFTSRELYVLRYAGDGFMGKRILSALHPRRHAGDSVNQAVARRSPLAAMLVPSAKEISEKNSAAMREMAASRAQSRLKKTAAGGGGGGGGAGAGAGSKGEMHGEKSGRGSRNTIGRLPSTESSPRRPETVFESQERREGHTAGGRGGERSKSRNYTEEGGGGKGASAGGGPRSASALGGYAGGGSKAAMLPSVVERKGMGGGGGMQPQGHWLSGDSAAYGMSQTRSPKRSVPFATS